VYILLPFGRDTLTLSEGATSMVSLSMASFEVSLRVINDMVKFSVVLTRWKTITSTASSLQQAYDTQQALNMTAKIGKFKN
jgi:hypothetical protein